MNVAIWHNLPSGGGKRQLYEHVKGLLARGHAVEAWCPESADREFLPLGELVPEHRVLLPRREPRECRGAIRAALHNYRTLRHDLDALEEHCRECARQWQSGGFDVLFANLSVAFHVSPVGRLAGLPSALYLAEPFRWLYEAQPDWPWSALPPPRRSAWSPAYLRWFLEDAIELQAKRVKAREEARNAAAYDRVLVNSLYTRETVLRVYGLESKVCYLGVDTEQFHPSAEPRGNYVIGLGVIRHRKGLDRAIRALGTIDRNLRPELVWVGNVADAAYELEMQRLAESLGVRFSTRVLVSDTELVGLLGRAVAMLYTPRLEPFGFAPLEANACETPVVAIAEGGIRETVQDGINGRLVPEDDPQALGDAVRSLVEDPAKASALGRTGRRIVEERWNWPAAIDRLEQHLSELAQKSRSRF